MRAVPSGRIAGAIGLAIVVGVLALYVRTAARDITFGDAPELTGAAIALGVAHPPGYPVWTILGHLFTLLPLGPLPFRVALLSAVAGAACAGVVYLVALRVGASAWAAAAAAIAFALSPLVWTWSIVPEVFPLNDFLAALLIFLIWSWHERPERTPLLAAAALVGGIGMANQQTIVLLAPACLYLLWRRRDVLRQRPRALLVAAAAFIAGLAPYLYLPLAAAARPAWSWGDISSLGDVIDHVLRRGYGTISLLGGPGSAGDVPRAIFALI